MVSVIMEAGISQSAIFKLENQESWWHNSVWVPRPKNQKHLMSKGRRRWTPQLKQKKQQKKTKNKTLRRAPAFLSIWVLRR